eukprot:gnl/Dysnectes_brevis/299_a333_3055.p1 GENE.gnl/Dysnectes_brevis/299_a333_3055~~gnl/Dysnectes_brevis/299_a333_3055.p1  ORF type:complete len:518 (-),score=167.02 gnl/Dysnectes_brevis/299_a333_3055:143-1696(-)
MFNRSIQRIIDHRGEFISAIAKKVGPLTKAPFTKRESEGNRTIAVVSRVRPVFEPEFAKGEFQVIFNRNPKTIVMEPTLTVSLDPKIKGARFSFDHTFGVTDDNEAVYDSIGRDLVKLALQGGISTCFASGQTGSGKTYTISALQEHAAADLFSPDMVPPPPANWTGGNHIEVRLAYYEILGDRCFDLLNPGNEVMIREDRFGIVQAQGATQLVINSARELQTLVSNASAHRKTIATDRNHQSSRSHAVLAIRVTNLALPTLEDGQLFVVDLAGSEGASDTKKHDKARLKEAAAINTSLMCLKECIRGRTLATSTVGEKRHVHVPYRRSRLTLLLKDAFELSSTRHTHTVVIAALSPLASDVKHSLTTLRYAAPIRVAVSQAAPPKADPRNPINWSYEQLVKWFKDSTRGRIPPEVIMPQEMSGMQLCRMPESVFLQRAMTVRGVGEKYAKYVYSKLWGLVVDSQVRKRKAAMKPRKSQKVARREKTAFLEELVARSGQADAVSEYDPKKNVAFTVK